MTRADPFGDLSDFAPKTPTKPVNAAAIEQIAQEHGFPSRQRPAAPVQSSLSLRRRYTTGRNQQLNIKATAETVATFYRLADARNVPLGELLEQALAALEKQQATLGAGEGRAGA